MPEAGSGWGTCERALVQEHDVLLLDLDGVVYVGPHAVAGAPEALARARTSGVRLAFVTNNAARPPEVVAQHLSELGVEAQPADVVTSAQAAATMLAADLPEGSRVLAIGGEGLRQALRARGLVPVTSADDRPVAVAQGFAPETSWTMLVEACLGVSAGLPWVATNTDLTIPTPRGTAPGNGALVQVVRSTTGATPRVAGKPFRPLMDESCVRTGAQRALVVGDRLDTDIAGAHAAGLPSLLVLTGVSGAHDLLRASPELRPSYVAADLSGLDRPHTAPRREGRWWVGSSYRAAWEPVDGDAESSAARLLLEPLTERSSALGQAREAVPSKVAGEDVAESGASSYALAGTGSSGAPDDATVDAIKVACAAVWERADAVTDESQRENLPAAAEDALRPWTKGLATAR